MTAWCYWATLASELLKPEKLLDVLAILASASIAAGAAILGSSRAAEVTMANALKLQDRDRKHDERSMVGLLNADLNHKLFLLTKVLENPDILQIESIRKRATSTLFLEAALPKLGTLSPKVLDHLVNIFLMNALIFRNVGRRSGPHIKETLEETRHLARAIGETMNRMKDLYGLDPPHPFKTKSGWEKLGLGELDALGFSKPGTRTPS